MMKKFTEITDRADIARYFEMDADRLQALAEMSDPMLQIWVRTSVGEKRISSVGYVFAEKTDIANTPEEKDDIRGVLEFLAKKTLPEFETAILNFNDLRLYWTGDLGQDEYQQYIRYSFVRVNN